MKLKKPNTPRIRFPEFTGKWTTEEIGKYLRLYIERVDAKTKLPVLTSSRRGLSMQRDYFDDRELMNEGEYGVLPRGYFTYRHMSDDSTFRFNINDLCDRGVVSKEYPVFVAEGVDPKFLYLSLNYGSEFKRFAIAEKRGGTRTRLYFNRLTRLALTIPSLPEQQKIADFISTVDDKIVQLTRKKGLLQRYKKGVMQQIFNQNIRFKDSSGKQFPKWSETPLSRFLIPSPREIETPSQPYLAIGVRSHFKGTFQRPDSDPKKIEMDKLFVVRSGDLIVNITFAWEGAMAIAKKEDDGGLVSHRFPTYTFNEQITSSKFFQYIYSSARFKHFLKLISPGGAGRNRVLNKKDFLRLKVLLPSVPEQARIAEFLVSLDSKIDFVDSQLENTKLFKKGLFQQMFV